MTNRENLPLIPSNKGVVVPTEQRSNLVARGLSAILGRSSPQATFPSEVEAERLFKLGMHYKNGIVDGEDGPEFDRDKALEYLTDASDLDHAEAQYELSYLLTSGTNQEQEESLEWLLASALGGFGPALFDWATHFLDEPEEFEEKKTICYGPEYGTEPER